MFNFMECTQMLFGSRVRYCITFKLNQKNFEVYRRKYIHDLKANVVKENLEGCKTLSISRLNLLLVSQDDKVRSFNDSTFQELSNYTLLLKLSSCGERYKTKIISMGVSQNEEYFALMTGHNKIMDEQHPKSLLIYLINPINQVQPFKLLRNHLIGDRSEFKDISMQFHFKIP